MSAPFREPPVARAGMLIRRPPAEVFEAFVDPAITRRFWFTDGSERLAAGRRVRWTWGMYGVHADVDVRVVEPPARLVIEWPDEGGPTTVEWRFTERDDGASTFVEIEDAGFGGDADLVVRQVGDAAGGFALVLAGCKAWLEHGIELGLVGDRHPA